jgi:hypothetical protein
MVTKKKQITEPEACAGCRHYLANRENEYGYCRRFPPIPASQDGNYATLWPVTRATEWCGEFSRQLNS